MDKSQKIGTQIYGYTVCLVAVITFLIAITSLMNAMIDLNDPLHSGWNPQGSPSLASFENYKMDVMKFSPKGDANTASYVPGDQTLRTMYEAAKSDKIQSVTHQANRSFIIGGMLIIICGALFILHWQWMRRINGLTDVTEANLSYAD
jgi:hypothetical protein